MGYNIAKLSKTKVDSNLNMNNLYKITNQPPPTLPTDLARLSDIKISNLNIDANKSWGGKLIRSLGTGLLAGDGVNLGQIPIRAGLEFTIDGGSSAITTGVKGHLLVPFGAQIFAVALLDSSDPPLLTGAIEIDIWNDAYVDFPPTIADSIVAANYPKIIAGEDSYFDAVLTGWEKDLAIYDVLAFNVNSCTDIIRCSVILFVLKTSPYW